ncbi:MAG: elongation factor G-binding protein [Neobacillus sp.]|nr:elongation factor G-binding protein [Neobacillus sp.]
MSVKYMKNANLNIIQKQVALIKDSYKKNAAPNVIQAAKDLANAKIMELFPNATKEQKEMLDLSALKADQEFDRYIKQLYDYLIPFPTVTEAQLKKMFPKNKKLKLPDLDKINHNHLTYLSWVDISSNKKFIVYELEGKMVGIECKYTISSKDNSCSFCNRFGQVAFISTITKEKKVKNPDYYKAIGNYICYDSAECNKKITNVEYLTSFLKESLGEKTVH